MKYKSRHPRIQYWFWNEDTLKNNNTHNILKTIAENSDFDTIAITSQGPGRIDFWDLSYKDIFADTVQYAHELGLKLVLQLWPKGCLGKNANVTEKDAAAVVMEHEGCVQDGKVMFRSKPKNMRAGDAPAIKAELLYAVAFKKISEGFYEEDSCVDVLDRAKILYTSPESLAVSFDMPDLEGYSVYVLVAHYHRIADVFSERMINDYKEIMDYYQDVPFDGVVVDEFKGLMPSAQRELDGVFRGRIYGKAFDRFFCEHNGADLKRTMFEMRYCPVDKDHIRISAINKYFDTFRIATARVEKFVADYSKKIFGGDSFVGLHNTYHNRLDGDEIWTTGCNWWEVPKKYAQTDEDITFPVRLGIACQCEENIIYDMYYTHEKELFFEKCMRDAAFGCRIHYLASGSDFHGVNVGSKEFLSEVKKYEDNVELLNMFDPEMPKMSLLVVFGFPALYNWYPDYAARNNYDINGAVNILPRVDSLWKNGIINALSTDDAIGDGRITIDENNRFDYCGNKFDGLLYLYPEYSKEKTLSFLRDAVQKKTNIRMIGKVSRTFEGMPYDGEYFDRVTIHEDCDIQQEMNLCKNDILDGCRLTDGSVVISNYESLRDDVDCETEFEIKGNKYNVVFRGVFAIKVSDTGCVEKLAAGHLSELKQNGQAILQEYRGKHIFMVTITTDDVKNKRRSSCYENASTCNTNYKY